MTQREEFEEKEDRDARYLVLKAKGTRHLVKYSESIITAVLANGKKVGEDRYYVAWGS